jgi:3-hydroxyisobutyrate dehydrogenase-like beta-hydroxyacid dehydrogenase
MNGIAQFSVLDDDFRVWKQAAAPSVIPVKMGLHDQPDVADPHAMGGQAHHGIFIRLPAEDHGLSSEHVRSSGRSGVNEDRVLATEEQEHEEHERSARLRKGSTLDVPDPERDDAQGHLTSSEGLLTVTQYDGLRIEEQPNREGGVVEPKFEVGFVGLGRMGAPMASRLMAAGLRVIVFDLRSEAVAAAVRSGAVGSATPAGVADVAPVVLVSLPTPEIVESVALGPNGLINGDAMQTYVDLSTSGPAVAEKVASELARRDVAAVDAPVSGGVAGATRGTLTLMLSGEPSVLEQIDPILAHLGNRRIRVGSRAGQGQMLKLINNMVSATAFAATAEALVLGRMAGLDAAMMLDSLNASTGRTNASAEKFPKYVLSRTFDFGFALGLQAKDVGLYVAEAQRRHFPSWIGSATGNLLGMAVADGMGELDSTALVQLLERWAEVIVSGDPTEG